nr:hypothetical protein [uncultured Rhodopila sp.]
MVDLDPTANSALSDSDLMLQFESIGDNCELGLVQRLAGAEPLGLLRFAGTPLHALLSAMKARFEGIAEPAHIRVHEESGEYMVKLTKYDFYYHAHVKVGDMTPEAIHQQQCRTVGFLAQKLIGDLETPSKILVFRQNEPLSAGDLVDLRIALSAYGPGVLLWVREACSGHPPGTVDVADDRLMIGYVRRLAARENVPGLDLQSWLTVLRRAFALSSLSGTGRAAEARAAQSRLASTELRFGIEGNAAPSLGYGWSGTEPGYQWSVGERSLLTVRNPGDADEYWLEMEAIPFKAVPLVPHQRLDVRIGGTLVQSFDPLPRGTVGCVVPGHLVAGRETIDIVLDHPDAASPMLVSGDHDDRRLAVCFIRLALVCIPSG